MNASPVRHGALLGSKLRLLRKRNGLTLEELSARCAQLDFCQAAAWAGSHRGPKSPSRTSMSLDVLRGSAYS